MTYTVDLVAIADEDDMASDSNAVVPTQQSVKAYVNALPNPKALTLKTPTSSEDISLFFTSSAITITEIRCVLIGSSTPSVTWTIRFGSDRSAAGTEVVTGGTVTTSTTTGSDVTSFNDATIPVDNFLWFETTAQSGTVDALNVTIIYTVD